MASWPATSMPPDLETVAGQVFTALADPTRRAILAALARDWDSQLGALTSHLDQTAHRPTSIPPHETGGDHD